MASNIENKKRELTDWERQEIVNVAKRWRDAGFLVGPAHPDDKRPHLNSWRTIYKGETEPPTIEEIERHILIDKCCDGIGVFGGAASKALEMLELDTSDPELAAEFVLQIEEEGLADVWEAITTAYEEQTPGGGTHWPFSVKEGDNKGNIKLALPEPTGNREKDSKATIETRGNGGWFVIAPSAGRTHPTGKPYKLKNETMDPANIVTITAEQRDRLYECARRCCKAPAKPTLKPKPVEPNTDGSSAGNKFNAATSWDDVLVPLGWEEGVTLQNSQGLLESEWLRPGKEKGRRSAIVAVEIDQMIVYSTGSELEATDDDGNYNTFSRWAVWTFYRYGGDFNESAKAIHQAMDAGMDLKDLAAGKKPPELPPLDISFALPSPAPDRSNIVSVATSILHANTYTEIGLGRLLADKSAGRLKYLVDRAVWMGFQR